MREYQFPSPSIHCFPPIDLLIPELSCLLYYFLSQISMFLHPIQTVEHMLLFPFFCFLSQHIVTIPLLLVSSLLSIFSLHLYILDPLGIFL